MEVAEGKPCPLCEAALAARRLKEVQGDESPMRLTLRNLPVLACEAPHRYFVGHGFPVWLLNALLEVELPKIPAGKAKGLLFRKYACCDCGAILPSGSGGARIFTAALAWKQTPAFQADISIPLYRCPSCGREQARSGEEIAKLLPAALVHAFKSAGIKAPG
jgi:hypothetical protein